MNRRSFVSISILAAANRLLDAQQCGLMPGIGYVCAAGLQFPGNVAQ
jgi:hypothetical protein